MQHLQLRCARVAVDGRLPADSVPAVLSALQEMRQLMHLKLQSALHLVPISAAAYTALAPSSKLQYLDISANDFVQGMWQEFFKQGRQLRELQVLNIARANFKSAYEDSDLLLTAADAQRLVSCCPNLQCLSAYGTLRDADAVAALRPLSGLKTLLLGSYGVHWAKLRSAAGMDWAQALAQLTTLVELEVAPEGVVQGVSLEADLLQLTTLRRLTRLETWHDLHQSMAWYQKVREGVGTLSNQECCCQIFPQPSYV